MCRRLSEYKSLGPKLDPEHRRLGLRRFPFALIYRLKSSKVQIVAVAHRRRRPGVLGIAVVMVPWFPCVELAEENRPREIRGIPHALMCSLGLDESQRLRWGRLTSLTP